MDTSSETLKTQAYLKANEIEEIIFHNYHVSDKTWSGFPTASYTVTVAEGIIALAMDHSHLYSFKWFHISVFQVKFQGGPTVDGDS